MKNKQNKKVDVQVAEQDYLDTIRDSSAYSSGENQNDTLLIHSLALDPTLDQMLWSKHLDSSPVSVTLKPISSKTHGFIDYAFAATLLVAPTLLGLKNKKIFGFFGASVALSALLTKDSRGLKPLFPLKTHLAIDVGLLSAMAVTAVTKPVRRHKNAVAFMMGLVTIGIATVWLTDWESNSTSAHHKK